jgi:hypothetical protein
MTAPLLETKLYIPPARPDPSTALRQAQGELGGPWGIVFDQACHLLTILGLVLMGRGIVCW